MCFSILVLDGFDIVAMGYVAPALIDDWHVTNIQLGPVLMAGLFGLAIGAMFAGSIADRVGRRIVIVWAVFFFGAMTLLCAWAQNLETLAVLRFLTGLGLGASQPNAATLISEYAPKRWRSLFVTLTCCGFTVGAATGGFLSAELSARFGWYSIFVVGGILPIALAVVLIAKLPESAKFLATKQKYKNRMIPIVRQLGLCKLHSGDDLILEERERSDHHSTRAIVSEPFRRVTLLLWIGVFLNMLTIYLLNSWLPVMVKDHGYTLADAAFVGAMMQIGGTCGNVALGWEMDRWNPNYVMVVTIFCSIVSALFIGIGDPDIGWLIILIFSLGFFINSANTGWTVLAASFYPITSRATGTGWMTAMGRIGAICGAALGGLILESHWTFSEIFVFLSMPLAMCAIVAFVKGYMDNRKRGKLDALKA